MNQFTLIKGMNLSLLELGVKGIQKMYKLEPLIFSYAEIKNAFVSSGMPNIVTSEMDTNYAFLNIETADPLVWDVMSLIHKFGYKYDYTDCDNFAFLTSSLFSFLYGINTLGVCWGDVYDNQTDKFLFAHYFNILISFNPSNHKFELWMADSLNPGMVKIEIGQPIVVNNWRYENLKNARYF